MIQIREVPLDSIILRKEFARDVRDATKQTDLVLSIKARGILYPLICMETPEGLTLIAGYRRHRAAQELGLPTVPCVSLNIGIDDAEILKLHENLYREDITPIAEAQAMDRLERTYHFTRSKIANLLGKSPSYVTQRLQILHWNPLLQSSLKLGHINYSVARELSSVTDEGQLRFMIDQIITSGASVRTVATWVQELQASRAIKDQTPIDSQPTASQKPETDKPTSCYTCAVLQSPHLLNPICVCDECLHALKDLKP